MSSLTGFAKTRLAPTPSGYLHAGNALNFLLTAALAKQCGAKLLLRIDDLDRERYRTAYAVDVFETLSFLNIHWNEGPRRLEEFESLWSQQCRMNLYEAALEKLKVKNAVFACTCSRTQTEHCCCKEKGLSLDAPKVSWRLHTTADLIAVRTLNGNTRNVALPDEMKNFVVRKKDGLPAYQLASVVDDLHFNVDVIVRGEDLWPSTVAQHFLARQLDEEKFSAIRFYHHPLLKTATGEKLSKSAGDTSIKQWREEKKTVEELTTYISQSLSLQLSHTDDLPTAFR